MTTDTKLRCSRCFHLSEQEDKVMLYGPAGREQALCVDNDKCYGRLRDRAHNARLEQLNMKLMATK